MSTTNDHVIDEQASPRRPGPGPRRRNWSAVPRAALDAIGVQNVSLLIALAALVAAVAIKTDGAFLSWTQFEVVGKQSAVIGVLAVMETVIIVLSGLDISVGSSTGLCSVVCALVFVDINAPLGLLAAVGVGALAGLVNGVIIVYGRMNPVVATLATLAAFQGIAQVLSNGRSVGRTAGDSTFTFISNGAIAGIPTLVWIVIVVAVIAHVVLRYTDIGRNIYAIGGNDTAARLAGININRYILGCYMVMGIVAAIAGILLTARQGTGEPTAGSRGLELQVVTAAALGGCALQGGRGTIVGTVLAVLLLGVLDRGISAYDVNPFWENVSRGALLIIAVVLQQVRSGERRIGMPT